MYYIYKLTSPSGKSYIGFTSRSIEERAKEHFSLRHKDIPLLYYAVSKYPDRDQWQVECLHQCDDLNEALAKEIELIATSKPEYNVLAGGQQGLHGHRLSEEHKRRIGEKQKAAWARDDGTRKARHAELARSTSEKNRGKPAWNKGMRKERPPKPPRVYRSGYVQTDHQKQRAREARMKLWQVTFKDGSTKVMHNMNLGEIAIALGMKDDRIRNLSSGRCRFRDDDPIVNIISKRKEAP